MPVFRRRGVSGEEGSSESEDVSSALSDDGEVDPSEDSLRDECFGGDGSDGNVVLGAAAGGIVLVVVDVVKVYVLDFGGGDIFLAVVEVMTFRLNGEAWRPVLWDDNFALGSMVSVVVVVAGTK